MALVVYQGPTNISDDKIGQSHTTAEEAKLTKSTRFNTSSMQYSRSHYPSMHYDRSEDYVGLVISYYYTFLYLLYLYYISFDDIQIMISIYL